MPQTSFDEGMGLVKRGFPAAAIRSRKKLRELIELFGENIKRDLMMRLTESWFIPSRLHDIWGVPRTF